MCPKPEISAVAALLAEPARTAMLTALVDFVPRPAAELAELAGISAPTASAHLAKLVAGGLLTMTRDGRQRLYRLSNVDVSHALEALEVLARKDKDPEIQLTDEGRALRFARVCYGSHVGGHLGVLMTDKMLEKGILTQLGVKQFDVTERGVDWFLGFDIHVGELHAGHQGIARHCVDWSELRPHLAGPLGSCLLNTACERGWMARESGTRVLQLSAVGCEALQRELSISRSELGDESLFSGECAH
jgi:DNA-binding transcriptional ArsR family regulator